MKTKKVIAFYFRFEEVEAMLDRLILKRAADSAGMCSAERSVDRVVEIIEKKHELCRFWLHLDGVMNAFCERDRAVLKNYALSLGEVDKKQAHRLAVSFTRRARVGLGGVRAGFDVMREYIDI